ncbi:hypothetical protein SAMN05444156_1319 [Verrucomicrobium sp. GAS474]|uniref:DUF892 family protein n=1 Tax=Verrucomicrobium sp. GAS474 TaxID=1882831 RepID=UPI00087B81C3|nr:DUF892 family protein [Verrucomicrobium sp. GAS474]SDT99430.1 hypothetical protein SAMN05444156_1319 [Verrucomicrobium sp. GAS474]
MSHTATLPKVHIAQLHDLYLAECQLAETLATLAKNAADAELRKGFLAQREQSLENAVLLKKQYTSLKKKSASGKGQLSIGLMRLLQSLRAEHQAIVEYTCAQSLAQALGFGGTIAGSSRRSLAGSKA